jgi:hypothetical protein
MSGIIERVARAIAIAHGDAWDDVPDDKSHWTENRGQFGGRFRDVNENFKDCYRDEARAAVEAMRPILAISPEVMAAKDVIDRPLLNASMVSLTPELMRDALVAFIDAALSEGEEG